MKDDEVSSGHQGHDGPQRAQVMGAQKMWTAEEGDGGRQIGRSNISQAETTLLLR